MLGKSVFSPRTKLPGNWTCGRPLVPRNSMFSANTEASLTHSSTGLLLSGGQARALVSSPSIFQRLSWLALPASMTLAAQGSVLAHIWKGGQNEGRLFFHLVKFFFITLVYLRVCAHTCVGVCAAAWGEGQRTGFRNPFSPSAMWSPVLESWLSDKVPGTVTHWAFFKKKTSK